MDAGEGLAQAAEIHLSEHPRRADHQDHSHHGGHPPLLF